MVPDSPLLSLVSTCVSTLNWAPSKQGSIKFVNYCTSGIFKNIQDYTMQRSFKKSWASRLEGCLRFQSNLSGNVYNVHVLRNIPSSTHIFFFLKSKVFTTNSFFFSFSCFLLILCQLVPWQKLHGIILIWIIWRDLDHGAHQEAHPSIIRPIFLLTLHHLLVLPPPHSSPTPTLPLLHRRTRISFSWKSFVFF